MARDGLLGGTTPLHVMETFPRRLYGWTITQFEKLSPPRAVLTVLSASQDLLTKGFKDFTAEHIKGAGGEDEPCCHLHEWQLRANRCCQVERLKCFHQRDLRWGRELSNQLSALSQTAFMGLRIALRSSDGILYKNEHLTDWGTYLLQSCFKQSLAEMAWWVFQRVLSIWLNISLCGGCSETKRHQKQNKREQRWKSKQKWILRPWKPDGNFCLLKSCGTGPAGGVVQQRQQQLVGNRKLIA